MPIVLSRRRLARLSACAFTVILTLAPVLLPSPGGQPARAETAAVAPAGASRLVTIGNAVTEIVYALGEEKRIVARDSTSMFPPEAMALPDVGYMRALSPEGVLSVDPDAILAIEGSGPPEAIDVLSKASVPIVTIPEGYDRANIVAKIEAVGAALGAEEKAAALAAQVAADLDAAQAATADIAARKRVLFVLSLQDGKVMASGSATAANGIIELAGAENAITEFQGYRQVTDEAVIAAAPDVILMMDRGGQFAVTEDEVFGQAAIGATPAAKSRALVRMDGGYLLGFGPRTAQAVRDLAHSLYGDKVSN